MKFGKRYSHRIFFNFSFGFYILFFVYYSSERDIVFNVLIDNKDIYSNSIVTETECLCQIKRGSILDTKVIDCFKKMLFRNENRQYNQYIIKDTDKFSHNFEPFEKLKDMNSNIEIFLCQHIKESDFLIFYSVLISCYLMNEEINIHKFYTILYFIEYFRIKLDNILRNIIKTILYSLANSNNIIHFDVHKKMIYFSKQDYFSHECFKIISQEYLKMLNSRADFFSPFFVKKSYCYIDYKYQAVYTEDRQKILSLGYEFRMLFSERISGNRKSINLFILILNTLDIKYVHISELNETNVTDYCLVLTNIKKKVEEILFFKVYIFSEIIRCIDANLNFINIKKIVFIRSKIENYLILLDYLKKISEFIFFEETRPTKPKTVTQINYPENLKLIKEIEINIQRHGYPEYSLKKLVTYLKNMPLENQNLYVRFFEANENTSKFKLLEVVNIVSKYWKIGCYFDYKGTFYNISITLTNLNLYQFTPKETILEENIKKLRITDSKITSNFVADILNINKLKSLTIKKLTHLNFNFTLPENHIIESEPNPVSLQNLFQNFDLVSIKKLNLEWLSITKSDSHALNNLLNLEQLKIEMICLNNIFFSELFCISTEYKIKECI
ncbi:hypothetical protein CWI38_0156p0020 [Hamiltosporidium tvaerminnensis]|uniref:Uncharacterized protein n=1 Tax=Hamiltosporidium tvaerminnensis TaxID=1176355 RepID=A0A4Q9M201_9MICR|nr:hypothetical protein CWI38_0156p0020 [Hamiltosporidium tvaerminnensis]